jgi:hypothetical protein
MAFHQYCGYRVEAWQCPGSAHWHVRWWLGVRYATREDGNQHFISVSDNDRTPAMFETEREAIDAAKRVIDLEDSNG